MSDKGVITMCAISGLFIIGRLSGSKLSEPRIFSILENGQRIQMSPLPGTPSYVILKGDSFNYPIPLDEKIITDLYIRVTDPEQIKKAAQEEAERLKKVVMPIKPSIVTSRDN